MKPYYEHGGIALFHGDAREIVPTLPTVSCAIVDPPYAQTSLKWDRWVMGWPDMVAEKTASMWCFGSLRMFMERADAFDRWRLSQDIVWQKHNGSNFHNDRFRRVHEQVAHFYRGQWNDCYRCPQKTADATKRTVRRKERPPHTGKIAGSTYTSLDGGPRLQRSVIAVRSEHGRAVHPTQKPLDIILPLLSYSCPPSGSVLDPFAGAGSSLVAAHRLGLTAFGVEGSEAFCEAAAKRLMQEATVAA